MYLKKNKQKKNKTKTKTKQQQQHQKTLLKETEKHSEGEISKPTLITSQKQVSI